MAVPVSTPTQLDVRRVRRPGTAPVPGLISRALGLGGGPRAEITTASGLDAFLRGGRQSHAGVSVTVEGAMAIAAFYDGVRIIAEDIGKLSYPVYRRGDGQDRHRAYDSPYYALIHDRPNSYQTSQQFRELLTAHAIVHGDGFALPNVRGGRVVELHPLDPRRVRVEQADDFELLSHVRLAGRRELTVTSRDIFHLRGISLDGVRGMGAIKYARHTLGTSHALERHAGRTFANGAKPGAVFQHPKELSDEAHERLQAELNEFTGDGAGGTMILEDGLTWHQVSLSNEDAQFLESRQFQIAEIARWLRLPPHMLGDLEHATFSNIEHQSIEYVRDTLLSWGVRWDNACNHTVLRREPDLFAELLFETLLRGDTVSQYQALRVAIGAPFLTRNEGRSVLNRNRLPGLDEMIVPRNVAAGDPGAPGSPAPEPAEVTDA